MAVAKICLSSLSSNPNRPTRHLVPHTSEEELKLFLDSSCSETSFHKSVAHQVVSLFVLDARATLDPRTLYPSLGLSKLENVPHVEVQADV